MNKLSVSNLLGTSVWVAAAIKVFGYIWAALLATYDASAFAIGGGSGTSGPHDIPIIPPLKRKQKPGGKKTRLPRPHGFPKIPPLPVLPNVPGNIPTPAPTPPPLDVPIPFAP